MEWENTQAGNIRVNDIKYISCNKGGCVVQDKKEQSVNFACGHYLKKQVGAVRLMKGFKRKYESLGEIGGNYRLHKPTAEEYIFLRGVFKKDYNQQMYISISLKKFERAFEGSKFEGMVLKEVLEIYFDHTLESNKHIREKEVIAIEGFFDRVLSYYQHEKVKAWLWQVQENKTTGSWKWIMMAYKENQDKLWKLLMDLETLVVLTQSHEKGILRAVAAAKVTKDPHSLDESSSLLKLYIYYLSYIFGTGEVTTAKERILLLERGNLLVDTGNRTVMTYGLKAFDDLGESLMWESFYKRREPLILTLLNLDKINRVDVCLEDVKSKTVICFENPSVFYAFIQKNPMKTAICVGGQINLAVYRLLEYTEKSDLIVYYHGDFDPEGLLIADKLKQQFGHIELFAYEDVHYLNAISDKTISDKRLKQLEQLTDSKLLRIAELMQQHKKAGYEEYMLEDLL